MFFKLFEAAAHGLIGKKLCLEKDGTEVVDDDGLQFLSQSGYSFMVLDDYETWQGFKSNSNSQSQANIFTEVSTENQQNLTCEANVASCSNLKGLKRMMNI